MWNIFTFFILFAIFSFIKTEKKVGNTCLSRRCLTNEQCQHYGYCNVVRGYCCLGKYGNCTYPGSHPIRPQIDCKTDDDCGYNYCDWRLKICCSEGNSPDSYCPGGLTYYGIEPLCREGKCSDGSSCHGEHCCPDHKVEGVIVTPLPSPYPLNIRCRDNEAPPFRNTFCRRGINRLAILGEFRINKTANVDTGRICVTNQDCSLSSVCVFTSSIGTCYLDPFGSSPPFNYLEPVYIAFVSSIVVCLASFGAMMAIYRTKKKDYYEGLDTF